jgi:hypothetical protein
LQRVPLRRGGASATAAAEDSRLWFTKLQARLTTLGDVAAKLADDAGPEALKLALAAANKVRLYRLNSVYPERKSAW